jgi:hypothetical protein
MAKKFLGFNPEQQFTLLSKLGYQGPKDPKMMEAFVSATPSAALKMGGYTKRAQDLLNKPQMATGGILSWKNNNTSEEPTTTTPTTPATPVELSAEQQQAVTTAGTQASTDPTANTIQLQSDLNTAQGEFAELQKQLAANPSDSALIDAFSKAQVKLQGAQNAYRLSAVPSAGETLGTAVQTPQSLVTPAQAATVAVTPEQFVAQGTGQVGAVDSVTTAKAGEAAVATAPEKTEAATMEATKVGDQVGQTLEGLEAATGGPSKAATVAGQLEGLMAQFEGGATPPWASGAMRQAMGIMQQRGLGASSMAGQAVVQAAMESAFAIASQDASTTAQFEMQNLNNQQQTAIFKTQQLVAGMFTDQAAENASKQFNAASKNQVDQFFAGLQESVSRFNADQINGIAQFNAGQENAVEQFNSSLKAQRDQFNSQNSLIVAQANAQWRQNIATVNTAAQNEANMADAKNANALTQAAMDQIWQRERDLMAFAFQASESQLERDNNLLLADKQIQANKDATNAQLDAQDNAAKAALGVSLVSKLFSW